MKKRKKLFTCLLSLILIFTMMPLTAIPANAAVNLTALYIIDSKGGTSEPIDIKRDTIVDSSGGWKWEKATSTLTLEGFDGEYIEANGDLNIVVKGSNTITLPANPAENEAYGIKGTSGKLNITGEGISPSLTVTQTAFTSDNPYVSGIDGRNGLVVSDCKIIINFNGTQGLNGSGIGSSNGDFNLSGSASLDIQINNGRDYTSGSSRGLETSSSGDIKIKILGTGQRISGVGCLRANGTGNIDIMVPRGKAVDGPLVIGETAGDFNFEGALCVGNNESSYLCKTYGFNIAENKKIIKVDASGNEVSGKYGFIHKTFAQYDEGIYLQDESGSKVEKGKIVTVTGNPLTFADSDVLNIPDLELGKSYFGKYFHGLVSGGKAPYQFSAEGLPEGFSIQQLDASYTSDRYARIKATPTAAYPGGTITLTVTDANNSTDSINITLGKVEKPPKYISVDGEKFMDSEDKSEATGKWNYEAASKTLTLDGYSGGPILSDEELNIIVKGSNTVTLPANPTDTSVYGIKTDNGKLNITGVGTSPSLSVVQTDFSKSNLTVNGIIGIGDLTITNCAVKIQFDGTESFVSDGIGSYDGKTFTKGNTSLDINIKNAKGNTSGIRRGIHAESTGRVNIEIRGTGTELEGMGGLYAKGTGTINIKVPDGRAIDGPLVIEKAVGTLTFEGSIYVGYFETSYFDKEYSFNIADNKRIIQLDSSNNEVAGKYGFVHKTYSNTDEGVCLQDESGNQVKKGKIETHTANPLVFADSDELNLKNLKVQEFYNGRMFHGLVSGGKAPYTFSADGLPEGLILEQESRIGSEKYAKIKGRPTAEQPAGTITLTVTDANNKTASIQVHHDAISVPKGVTGITLDKTELKLAQNGTATLTAKVSPDDATIKTVLWSSSNVDVARVDNNGKIKPIAPGKAIITATTKQGNFSKSCTVYVKEDTPNAIINYQYETLQGLGINEEYQISGDGVNDTFKVTDISYPIKDTWLGKTLTLTKTNAEPESSSDEQVLNIPARPAAPTGIGTVDASAYYTKDGKITGVAVGMQYCVRDTPNWYPVEGSEVTGLGCGEYEIRVARTESSFKGHPTTVTIGYNPLTLAGGTVYKIPEGIVGTEIAKVDISKAVKGGRTPYVFSKTSGPDWLQVDRQGKITGTRPSTETAATTADIKVTDEDNTVQTFTITVGAVTKPKGVTVSGTIKNYGSASEVVTVTLLQGTSIIGSPQILTGVSGSAPYDQAYSFGTVPAGTYTLKVEKKGHAPWTENITIGIDSITSKNVTVYLWGDVNRDGVVTAADAQEIQRNAAKLSSAYDTGSNKSYWILRADVNRDGKVTAADAQEIQRNAAKLSSAIDSLS